MRPEKVTVTLLANGEEIDQQEIGEADDGSWSFAFEDLYRYEDGEEIVYTVQPEIVDGYGIEVTPEPEEGPSGDEPEESDGIRFAVNYVHETQKTQVDVTKIWEDDDNRDCVRPESVTIRLFADGVEKAS